MRQDLIGVGLVMGLVQDLNEWGAPQSPQHRSVGPSCVPPTILSLGRSNGATVTTALVLSARLEVALPELS